MSKVGLNSVAKAGLQSVIGGTNAPASALGPYSIVPFEDDLRKTYQQCSYVESPLTGNIYFNISLEHQEVSENCITWSHDYTGDIYWINDEDLCVLLTMPGDTSAFYFYAQPRGESIHTITASAYDGINCLEQISQEVNGNSGACYFGFYGTDGSAINKIYIRSDASYAIGEFGISMLPAPEAFLLGNIGICAVLELMRHKILKRESLN